MPELLNLLIIEDSEDDVLLVLRELRQDNFEPCWERVQTAEALQQMLANHRSWDAIVSDYHLPNFDAPRALEIVRQNQCSAPFILISGAIEIQQAIGMIKAGAYDYCMKNNLALLPKTIRSAKENAQREAARKQAEQSLIESEAKQRAILAAIPDLLFRVNSQGVYQEVFTPSSAVFQRFQGRDPIGLTLADFFPPEVASRKFYYLQQALHTGALQVYEQQVQVGESWRDEEVRVIKSSKDEVLFIIRDISDRKQLERKLTHTQKRLGEVLDSAIAGITRLRLYSDLSIQYEYISPHWEKTFGYTVQELIADANLWRSRIHCNDWDGVVLPTLKAILSQEKDSSYAIEYRFYRQDNSPCWILANYSAQWYAPEKYWHVTVVDTDITDRKQAEVQLQSLIEGTATSTGQNFFPALVEHLAKSLQVSFALVTELIGEELHALAFWANGTLHPPFTYPFIQTPCGRALQDGMFHCACGVQQQFPADVDLVTLGAQSYLGVAIQDGQERTIGNLCVLHEQSIPDPQRAVAILRVFAARAAAELERQQASTALEHLNQELEREVEHRTMQLREREARYYALMDEAGDAILVTDLQGNILEVNRKAESLFGYTRQQFTQMSQWCLYPPQEVVAAQEAFSAIVTGRCTQRIGVTILRQDGQITPVDISTAIVTLGNTKIVQSTFRDVSDRHQAQQELQESEARLQAMINHASSIIYMKDCDGRYTLVNQAFLQYFGFSMEEVIGKTNAALFPPQTAAVLQKNDEAILCEGVIQQQEETINIGQKYYTFLSSRFILRDRQGEPYALCNIATDITDRKVTEAALQQENDFRQQILENMGEGLCVYYEIPEFPFVYFTVWNARMEAITGYSLAEINRLGWYQTLYPDPKTRERTIALMERQWTGENLLAETWEIQRRDGQKRTIAISTSVITTTGSPTPVLALVQDITQRQQTEEENRLLKERLEFLLAYSPATIYSCTPSGVYETTFISKNIHAILGYKPEDVVRTPGFWVSRIHPDDLPRVFAELPILLEYGSLKCDYRTLHQNGYYVWLRDEMRLVRDGEGNPLEVVGYRADISEYKHAEETLQDLSDRLTLALKAGAVGTVDWDLIQRAGWGDKQLYEMYGWKDLGVPIPYQDWLDRVHHDDRPALEAALEAALHRESDYDIEFRIWRTDSTLRWIRAIGKVQRNSHGIPMRMTGINQDITDRKQAELRLQKSQRFIQQVADASPNILYLYDMQAQRYIYANQETATILGYTPAAIQAMGPGFLQNLVHLKDQDSFAEHFARLDQAKDGEILEHEYRIRDAHGEWRWFYSRDVVFRRDRSGRVRQIIGTAQDITARRRAEQTIRQQMERERLLYEITQRIRQSLDLQTIFDTACQEIRHVLQADRVGIFKFCPQSTIHSTSEGEFVAESVVEGLPSVIAARGHYFSKSYLSCYTQGQYTANADIDIQQWEAEPPTMLRQFLVRADLVMPLLCGSTLWGLLCMHQCRSSRHWQQAEIDFTQQLSNQIAIAIQQAILYEQIQAELVVRKQAEAKIAQQLRQQEALGAITQRIRESLDVSEILTTVTRQVKDVLQADRVLVFRFFPDGKTQIVAEAVVSALPSLKHPQWENEVLPQDLLESAWQGQPFMVANGLPLSIYMQESCPEEQVRSRIVAPILQEVRDGEEHRWVAPGKDVQLWGVLVVHACRQQRIWQEPEAQLLQQIANQLAIAVQQASLFAQLQQELKERQQAQQLLTERNQQLAVSNEELARATRLKDEFLANMSHELRTPLNAILGMNEGLQEGVFGKLNTEQAKALEMIERSSSHLLELINDILDLSKIESGQMELDCHAIPITPLCQASLGFIRQQAMKKRLQLETQIPHNLPDLFVDERRIRQVLINLLNNAVKFTPEGGRITLKVSRYVPPDPPENAPPTPREYLRIAIIDTGIGIAPEHMSKLFQPFVQIDSALNRQYAGTGLGLALVRRIVDLHGGQVGLTSEVGVGSCFTVDLPATMSPVSQPSMVLPVEVTPRFAEQLESPLILIAEDNEASVSTIVNYLRAKKYRILVAKNGEEALDLAQANNPDLILMDIQMPGMDGLEAMRQIRHHPNLSFKPIIALTALAMAGDRDRCLAAGANDYLSKPVKLKQLITMIQALIGRDGSELPTR